MKLKYLFSLSLSSALLAIGCTELSKDSFDNIKLDKTFVSIPSDGGEVVLKVTAGQEWKFVKTAEWPDVIKFKKDANNKTYSAKYDFWGNLTNPEEQIDKRTPSWLAASVLEGAAGETEVTFSAEAFNSGREFTLGIVCGKNKQYVVVRQGSLVPVEMTSADILEKAVAGGAYITSGIVTQLESASYASYGKFYLNDGTGSKDVQVYGQTDESKKAYPGLEVGDYVKFSGTWSSYGNFENVEIIEIKKSLIKAVTEKASVAKGGAEFVVKVAYKGNGVFTEIPEDCDWITYAGMDFIAGVPTKLVPSPADTAVVKFVALENNADVRTCKLVFKSYKGKDSSEAYCEVTQKSGLAYFEESFSSESDKFTIENVTLPEALTYVWKYDSKNGYMKASAHKDADYASVSLLKSTEIDLTDAETAVLSFEHTGKYFNGQESSLLLVLAKKSTDAEWTQLTVDTYPTGNDWNFVKCDIDLAAFTKSKIQIAFKYISTSECAPTWEVKNVIIK